MKRVRCPKCDNYITFDEKKYTDGQSLVFQCPQCGKQFGIRIGVSKLRNTQKEDTPEENAELMRGVLSGRIRGAKRAATLLNAAAAISAGGTADTLADAVAQARASLDTGAALAKLEALVAFRA